MWKVPTYKSKNFISGIGDAFKPENGRWKTESKGDELAVNYVNGLLNQNYRKSMQPIAKKERVCYSKMQNFITESPWNPVEAQDKLTEHMKKMKVVDDNGLIILDDTGQPKQGNESVGVARQYCPPLGKVANCQISVNALYTIPVKTKKGSPICWTTGFRLYLPETWINDEKKRKKTGIPPETKFKTKTEIALELINKCREHNLPHKAVGADCGYGRDSKFRIALREMGERYILGLPPDDVKMKVIDKKILPLIRNRKNEFTINELAKIIPPKMLESFKFKGKKSKKETPKYCRVRVRVLRYNQHRHKNEETDEEGWLIIRRDGDIVRGYITWKLDRFGLKKLAEMVHLRSTIEQSYREMKDQLGLDNFEGRKYLGWYHHYMLVVTAHAYLNYMRMTCNGKYDWLPTLPEMMQILLTIRQKEIIKGLLECSETKAQDVLKKLCCILGWV